MENCPNGLKYALSGCMEIHPCVLQDIGPLVGPRPCSHSTTSLDHPEQGIGYRWPCAILGWLVPPFNEIVSLWDFPFFPRFFFSSFLSLFVSLLVLCLFYSSLSLPIYVSSVLFSRGHATLHLAVSVRPSVILWITSGFCITAPAQPSMTGLPCIRPCYY